MEANVWLEELKRICASSDWGALSVLRHKTNQPFAKNMDYSGLRKFYEEVLEAGLDEEKYNETTIESLDSYSSGLSQAFSAARDKLNELDGIKAVYFEYFFDGGDSCSGNVFLCTEYSEEDDGWGAEFEDAGIIEGPSVFEYLNIDPDFEWEDLPRYIAEEYANGVLLSATLENWAAAGLDGLPFAFANHDHEMVRVPPT